MLPLKRKICLWRTFKSILIFSPGQTCLEPPNYDATDPIHSQQTKTLKNNFSLKEIKEWLFSSQISERLVCKMTILPSKIKQFVAKMIILLTIQGNDRLGQWPLKQRIPQRWSDDDKKFLFLEDTINKGEMLNYFLYWGRIFILQISFWGENSTEVLSRISLCCFWGKFSPTHKSFHKTEKAWGKMQTAPSSLYLFNFIEVANDVADGHVCSFFLSTLLTWQFLRGSNVDDTSLYLFHEPSQPPRPWP